jgi:hypothetical protein
MNRPIAEDELSDKPLDPAVERVRRKLVRFAVINIGILLLALAVVIAALAWRTVSAARVPGETVEASLTLPRGARVVSHSLTPAEIALFAALPEGGSALFVFARADGRLVGRYPVSSR